MKQVVYIEINEEITSIYDRVKRLKQRKIYLVVPRKAVLFQSGVNLKIIRGKFPDKELIIVTTDRTGRHLAERAGFAVCSRIEVESVEAETEETPKMRIEPIQARKNEVVRDTPRRIEKKVTIGELIREFRKKHTPDKKSRLKNPFYFPRSNPRFLVITVLSSIGLFFLISYIALPGATLYVRPKFDHVNHTVNLLLVDKRRNQNLLTQGNDHIIASEIISTTAKQTKFFNTTSKRFDGVNAKGRIKVINTTDEPWQLKGGTRFQSPEGLIFRTTGVINVPAATVGKDGAKVNGMLDVGVEADPFDLYQSPVGDRGNIPPSKFSLPGLSRYNQGLIWGESAAPMAGGISKYTRIVLEEDIEAAKRQLEDSLILTARDELRTYLDELNQLNNTSFVLLDDRRYLKTNLDEVRVSDGLVGTSKDKFEVFARITAQGLAYDFDQMFSLLKEELKGRAHPDMHIREDSIRPENITYEAIEENEALGQIKITATVQGIQEYVIDSSLEAGLRFAEKVREKVIGLPVEEALDYVINLPEVDVAEIKTWPFWLSKMPRISDNIEIKMMEGQSF